ncbi:Uncharacterised protein [Sphingobacterium daejeonense]|nr:Uncharacterised protein [Sphingobacterium daejeonense]
MFTLVNHNSNRTLIFKPIKKDPPIGESSIDLNICLTLRKILILFP